VMTLGLHELVLCKLVLELGESGFDAGVSNQALVARLVACVVC
jgi:hypothetical protein